MSEFDLLMDNARLRDEIEPFLDESVFLVDTDRMSVRHENEFLSSLLAWERAPVLPISQWFEPELIMPEQHSLTDHELNQQLHQLIGRLYEKNILLMHTEHLSDRQLYCLIMRDILPAQEKKVFLPQKFFLSRRNQHHRRRDTQSGTAPDLRSSVKHPRVPVVQSCPASIRHCYRTDKRTDCHKNHPYRKRDEMVNIKT